MDNITPRRSHLPGVRRLTFNEEKKTPVRPKLRVFSPEYVAECSDVSELWRIACNYAMPKLTTTDELYRLTMVECIKHRLRELNV